MEYETMQTFTIQVTQAYRATRVIDLEVPATDAETALEDVASGGVDLPAFDSPDWQTGWELMDEYSKFTVKNAERERLTEAGFPQGSTDT